MSVQEVVDDRDRYSKFVQEIVDKCLKLNNGEKIDIGSYRNDRRGIYGATGKIVGQYTSVLSLDDLYCFLKYIKNRKIPSDIIAPIHIDALIFIVVRDGVRRDVENLITIPL